MRCQKEIGQLNLYVSIIAEGLSVAFLVFIGGTVYLRYNVTTGDGLVVTATVFGLTLAILSQCLKDVSGAHVNPAITMACILTTRVTVLRGILYMIFQTGGGILGAFVLREMTPKANRKRLAMTTLSPNLSMPKGIGYEIGFMFLYTWVYFASKTSRDQFKGFGGPFAIGLTYWISHVVLLPLTGCSLNPARSLGPAVIMEEFADHWIYWAGPILSASLAGLLYDFVFRRAKNKNSHEPITFGMCCKPSREDVMLPQYQSEFPSDYFIKQNESGV